MVRLNRPGSWSSAPLPVALAALVVLVFADGWRIALVVAVAAGAIAATRIRFAQVAAAALVTVVMACAITGNAIGADERPADQRR